MKKSYDLFNWFFENYEKTSANKNRLDAADLKVCMYEHDREIIKLIDKMILKKEKSQLTKLEYYDILENEINALLKLKNKLKRLIK